MNEVYGQRSRTAIPVFYRDGIITRGKASKLRRGLESDAIPTERIGLGSSRYTYSQLSRSGTKADNIRFVRQSQ